MKPPLLILAVVLAAPVRAAPACPPPGSGPVSANWGADYRERIRGIFDAVKAASGDGIDPQLDLINVNDLRPQNGSIRTVAGSPLAAVEKGTEGLPHDAVIYTFGVFEIACDEAQLAVFMAHEMRHIKRVGGLNHLDRVRACTKDVFTDWANGTDLSAYPTDAAALAAFRAAKGAEVAAKCVKPTENEADAFALALAPRLPYRVESDPERPDPNRDARVRAFANAETWLKALGEKADDPAHGTLAERAAQARRAAAAEALQKRAAREAERLQSLP